MSLDENLLAAAKSVAARRGTTVTGMVRSALEQQIAVDGMISASGASGVLQTLSEYSTGKLSRAAAMKDLGIEDYGSLLQLMSAAGVPRPIVPTANRKAMVARMLEMMGDLEGGR